MSFKDKFLVTNDQSILWAYSSDSKKLWQNKMAELEESTDVSIPFEYHAPKDKRHFTDEVSFQKFCRILDQFLKFNS